MVTAIAIAGIAAAVAVAGGGAAVAIAHVQKKQKEERNFCEYCERACPGEMEDEDEDNGNGSGSYLARSRAYATQADRMSIYNSIRGRYSGRGGYGDEDDDDDDNGGGYGNGGGGGGYGNGNGRPSRVCSQCRSRCRRPRYPRPPHTVPPTYPDNDYPDPDRPDQPLDRPFYFDEHGIRHGPRLGKQVGGFDYAPGQGIGLRPGGSGGIPTIGNVGSFGVLYRTPQSSTGLPIGGSRYPRYGSKGTFSQGNCMCDSVNCCYSQDVYHKSGLPQTVTRCEPINYGNSVQACEDAFYEFEEASFAGQQTYYARSNLAQSRMARRLS